MLYPVHVVFMQALARLFLFLSKLLSHATIQLIIVAEQCNILPQIMFALHVH